MKPAELYEREPIRADFDLFNLFGCYFNHMPEVGEDHWWQLVNEHVKNDRLQIRYYKDHSYDGRRIWRLASVWFDDTPFMIIQNAGREGDDHAARFVTDVETYKAAAGYLKSILPLRFEEIKDVVDPDQDIKDLTSFYSDSLESVSEIWR